MRSGIIVGGTALGGQAGTNAQVTISTFSGGITNSGTILGSSGLTGTDGILIGGRVSKGHITISNFSGNIALKTAEGTAKQIGEYLRSAMRSSLGARIGYLFARRAFDSLRKKMDPRKANGGVFLGLGGIVIKSHGSADGLGYAGAVEMAYDMVRQDLLARIGESLALSEGMRNTLLPAASAAS